MMFRLAITRTLTVAVLAALCRYLPAQQASSPDLDRHLQQAQLYLDRENYAGAARELRAAIAIHPQIRGAYYQLGFALFQMGQFAEAEKPFTEELQFQPPDPYSLYYLGRISLERGEQQKALSSFNKSLSAGEVLDVRQKIASGYLRLGRVDEAVQFLQNSLRVRPEESALHYLLGRSYKQQHRTAEAQAEFDAAARWKTKFRNELISLAQLRRVLGSDKGADATASMRELSGSSDSDILLAAATALGDAGRHQDALPFLVKAINVNPNLAEAHYDLGRAYVELDDAGKAEPELQKAIALKPGFYEAEVLMGTLLVADGQAEEAIKHLRAAVKLRADSSRLLTMLGLQYYQQRYYADAIDILNKAVRLDSKNPDPRYLLIEAYYRNLEYERALNTAQETCALFPDNALSYYHTGAQLNNFGRLPEARKQLEIALTKDPKLLEARAMLGDVYFKMGEPEESLKEFRRVLDGDTKLMEAHAGIGRALIQLKRYAEAADAMQAAIQIDDKLASLHLYLSQAYRGLGRSDQAKQEAATFSRLNQQRATARDQEVDRKYSN